MAHLRSRDLPPLIKWIAIHELWLFAPAGLLLLFPYSWLPFAASGWIALLWLCRGLVTRRFSRVTKLEMPVMVLLVMTVTGLMISVDPTMSSSRAWGVVLGALTFYAIVNGIYIENQRFIVVGALGFITLAMTVVGLVGTDWQAVRLIDIPWLYAGLPSLIRGLPGSGVPWHSDLINPRLVGLALSAQLPLFLPFLFYSRKLWLRILSGVVILFGGMVLILSQALQGITGVIAAIYFLLVWRSRWWLLLVFMLAGIVLVGVWIITPEKVALYLLSTTNPVGVAITLRLDMWTTALQMLRDMPITGIGLNTYPILQSQFYPGYIIGPNEPHAHSLYLQTALDQGLPGLFALLWLMIGWFIRVRSHYKSTVSPEMRLLLMGGAASVCSYLVGGMADVMTLGAKPAFAVWALMAVCIIPGVQDNHAPFRRDRLSFSLYAWGPLLLLLFGVAGILLLPGQWQMNYGFVQAHRVLFRARQEKSVASQDVQAALEHLESVAQQGWHNPRAFSRMGNLYAWHGQNDLAMAAFQHQVALEAQADPYRHFYPPVYWLRQLGQLPAGEQWQDLLHIYQNWNGRYPDRAEYYLLKGLIYYQLGGRQNALTTLSNGNSPQVIPSELLPYALEQLGP